MIDALINAEINCRIVNAPILISIKSEWIEINAAQAIDWNEVQLAKKEWANIKN